MRSIASVRSARRGGLFALGAVLVLGLAGCQSGMNSPVEQTMSASQETIRDQQSCNNPKNVWVGRMASMANSDPSGGGTGRALEACFATRQACHTWLMKASGGANGVIVEDRCTLTQSSGS